MKGQKLFVRPISVEDRPRLDEFYRKEAFAPEDHELGRDGLIGFLVGEVAAHMSFEVIGHEMEIGHIWVARELRRKRVARVMLDEARGLARKLGLNRLAVRKSPLTDEPLRRLGFVPSGDRLVDDIMEER